MAYDRIFKKESSVKTKKQMIEYFRASQYARESQ